MIYLLSAGVLLLLGGLITAVISAFRARPLWAWALIIAPLVYPLYVHRHWSEARVRNGSLVAMLGLALVVSGLYGGARRDLSALVSAAPPSVVQEELQWFVDRLPVAGPADGPLSNAPGQGREAHGLQPPEHEDLLLGSEALYLSIEPLPPSEDRRVPAPRSWDGDYRYRPVPLDTLASFVGRPVRVKTFGGRITEGRLAQAEDGHIFVGLPLRRGEAAYGYDRAHIAQVEVYARSEELRSRDPGIPRSPGGLDRRGLASR